MSKRKLLLADDSVTIQKVVNLTFADEGIEVISFGDGDSAMEKVVEISPDLIMADVNMPGLTGYEICERVRQDERLRQTPVILLVGSFEPFDEEEARRVGADDFLTKPFQSIRQLVNKVTLLLNSKSSENGDIVEAKDAGSLEDTLEMEADDLAPTTQPVQYGDTGYDDEMIQTNRPSGFTFDETQRFESRDTGELSEPSQFETQERIDGDILEDAPPSVTEETETTEEEAEEILEETESVTDEIQVDASDEIAKTESVAYEIKDEESLEPEIERKGFTYEIESNSGVAYEIKEDVLDEIETSNEVSDEIKDQETVSDEIEEVEDSSQESVADEISEKVSDEIETSEDISHKINDYEIVSDEMESKDAPAETISDEIIEDEIPAPESEKSESESEKTIEIDEAELAQTTPDEEIPLPEFASVLESEEDDILQLPPIELELEEAEAAEVEPPVEATTTASPIETTAFVATAESNTVIDSPHISPELIDMIVQKVLERLSEKAIKEVAWEVVPQMTELIVKKMAEEKLRE